MFGIREQRLIIMRFNLRKIQLKINFHSLLHVRLNNKREKFPIFLLLTTFTRRFERRWAYLTVDPCRITMHPIYLNMSRMIEFYHRKKRPLDNII